MKTENKDINLLKSVADTLINEMNEGFILFINVSGDKVNFISRSNCSVDSGRIVKQAAILSAGNGGGSKTFASGAGKNIEKLDEIYELVKSELENA